jgi:hypothetical protein
MRRDHLQVGHITHAVPAAFGRGTRLRGALRIRPHGPPPLARPARRRLCLQLPLPRPPSPSGLHAHCTRVRLLDLPRWHAVRRQRRASQERSAWLPAHSRRRTRLRRLPERTSRAVRRRLPTGRGVLPRRGACRTGPLLESQLLTGLQQIPMPVDQDALVISDNADIYGTVDDLRSRSRGADES